MGDLEIIAGCPGDISWVSWKYLMVVLRYLMGVLQIFDGCPADI